MSVTVRPTAFHVRTASHNNDNAWVTRSGFTVPAHFGDVRSETLAARVSAVLADISPFQRLRIHGEGAALFLSAASGRDAGELPAGSSRTVQWCSSGGGLRGFGTLARFGETNFTLAAHDADMGWFERGAERFKAVVRDETAEKGFLVVAGPASHDILANGGLRGAADLEPGRVSIFNWRGLGVTVSRWRVLGINAAYEVACNADDALLVFDRLWDAGRTRGLTLAGQDALDTIQLESGIPLAGMDFQPARDAAAATPPPASIGGEGDESELRLFGVELDGCDPAPFAQVLHEGAVIGWTLRSAYSPALRRGIALAQIARATATAYLPVNVRLSDRDGIRTVSGRLAELPFLR